MAKLRCQKVVNLPFHFVFLFLCEIYSKRDQRLFYFSIFLKLKQIEIVFRRALATLDAANTNPALFLLLLLTPPPHSSPKNYGSILTFPDSDLSDDGVAYDEVYLVSEVLVQSQGSVPIVPFIRVHFGGKVVYQVIPVSVDVVHLRESLNSITVKKKKRLEV